MYESFYNLQGRPFQLTPDPRFYFGSKTHKKAMAYLTYGLNQGEGFIIVTGDIGTGKTTLIRHLFDTLDRNEFVAAMIVSTQLSAEDLLRSVVAAFGLDAQAEVKGQLLSRLEQYLREQFAHGRRALLVVDEGQNLSNAALEEMRMLSNFQEGDRALVQSFIVGQPEFRDRVFGAPELEQLRQRIIATHHLEPMEPDELADYIQHRLSLVGWDNDPAFTADAVEAIYRHSAGVPRRLNTLCSRILLYGALEELHTIDGDTVASVISDMAVDNRDVTPVSSARTPAVNLQNDASIPLENAAPRPFSPPPPAQPVAPPPPPQPAAPAAPGADAATENRLNKLEDMMKSQDQTLQQLTQLMAQMAGGANKDGE